jgi:hypothetical protein
MSTISKAKEFSAPSEYKKWLVAGIITLLLVTCCTSYVAISGVDLFSLQAVSVISAAVASFLLATALVASSVSYYIGWPNMRWGYQKQIGVLAFWVAILYCVTLILLFPELYGYGLVHNLFSLDVLLGGTAIVIFAAMVGINSKPIAPYFSWDTIKFVLGLGYVGYALLVIRAILLEWSLWEAWLRTFEGYPPGRLVLSSVALGVLLLRISIPIHIAFKREWKK